MLVYLAVSAPNAVAVPPAILAPPVDKIAFVGQSATFNVIASHVGALSYQWLRNGAIIGGAVASSYTIPTVSAASLGSYSVRVTEGLLSTTSAVAILTVVTQPTPRTVIDGGSVTFSVTNLGPAAITYQWQKDGVAISGATNSSYTFIANYATDNGHLYRVVVNGPGGPATSATALLTVTPIAPVIVTQPANQTVPDFTTAIFSVVATGSALTYQWQRSLTLTGNNFASVPGATNSTYSLTVSRSANNNTRYRVLVSRSGASTVTSSSATLMVTAVGVQILVQPSNTVANYGRPANMTVVARASGALSYLWQRSNTVTHVWNTAIGAGISGATTATLAFNATATANQANNGTYRVIVNAGAVLGAGGIGATSVTSLPVTFTIVITPPTITAQPVSLTTTAGTAQVTFTVGAFGFPLPTYQWQRFNGLTWVNLANGLGANALYSGVTTPTLTVASGSSLAINVSHAGSYRVVLNNLGGSVTSQIATLRVIQTFAGLGTINVQSSTATPYPRISASVPAFVGGQVEHVRVTLNILRHEEPYDMNALLVGPGSLVTARKAAFAAFLGVIPNERYSYGVSDVSLTFDDSATATMSSLFPVTSGAYQPTVATNSLSPTVVFPAPAPIGPYPTTLSAFNGFTQPTAGGWRLYINDIPWDVFVASTTPRIISSWSLTLTVGPVSLPPDLTATVALNPLRVLLSWTDNANNETGFEIQRAIGNGAFTTLTTVGANVTTFTDTTVLPNTTYRYQVRAVSTAGNSAFSNIATHWSCDRRDGVF